MDTGIARNVVLREYFNLFQLTGCQFKSGLNYKPLFNRYEEPWRKYHTLEHIADGFLKLRSVFEHINNPFVVWCAWLYHDAIYVPGSPTRMNEYYSALLAEHELLEMGTIPRGVISIIKQSIIATWDHLVPNDYEGNVQDLHIMLDVDLSGFGDSHDLFVEARKRLREEYALIDEVTFAHGSAKFLGAFLNRSRIFQSPYFTHLEEQAQTNLLWASVGL